MSNKFMFESSSDTYTYSVGAKLGELILNSDQKHAFVAVYGDLGAGKTVFTRGFASVTSPGSRVKSPTYTIVNEYLKGNVPVYHFDFYRIESTDELYGIGFDDYVHGGICIAEWCEKLGSEIPKDVICVDIKKSGDSERIITVEFPKTEVYSDVDLRI